MVGRKKSTTLITPLELEIMQVLWETGPANVQTMQEGLKSSPPLAYTTVQTMLNVLHRKGKVKRKLRGRAFEYAPTVTREKIANHAVREMIERLFSGSVECDKIRPGMAAIPPLAIRASSRMGHPDPSRLRRSGSS